MVRFAFRRNTGSSVSAQFAKVVVVIPTYNERENLPVLAEKLGALGLAALNLLVVDDDSPDGTGKVAEELAESWAGGGRVTVLHRTEKNGLGRAYVDGMTLALAEGADVVVQMDADLSHPASVVPEMVRLLEITDAGLVVGSRYVPGGSTASDWPWRRKALSAFANAYVNAVLHLGVKDATAGFKAWRATTLRSMDLESVRSNGYSFQVEMTYRAVQRGARVVETPIHFEERAVGASKMSFTTQLESAVMPWKLRFGGRSAQAGPPAQGHDGRHG
jgi:dolichol-phosphate mannosyltransferase